MQPLYVICVLSWRAWDRPNTAHMPCWRLQVLDLDEILQVDTEVAAGFLANVASCNVLPTLTGQVGVRAHDSAPCIETQVHSRSCLVS